MTLPIDPPIEILKGKFSYDPATGVVFRLTDTYGHVAGPVGSLKNGGYIFTKIKNRSVAVHRIAWAMHYGEWPDGYIDHINGVRGDNRISNLRTVQKLENAKNKRPSKLNKSGFTGVSWCAQKKKWHSYIGINYRHKHLGFFDEYDHAVEVRREANRRLGYHDNHGCRNAS